MNYSAAQKVSPNIIPDSAWLLDLEDIEKDTSRIITRKHFSDKQSKSTKAAFLAGDILYGKLRPYLNKILVADSSGYCTTEIVPLRAYEGIFPEYVMCSLKRPDFLSYVNSKTYGINLPRLGTEDARKAIFPLPPFAEQKRIVAKVKQLMKLCDELEERQKKRRSHLTQLNQGAIAQLLTATPDEFGDCWQRICNNFDLLYSLPENIGKLRQAILQLAVQGKLVPQDPSNEPVSELLERIRLEKEEKVKEGKIRRAESLPPIDLDDAPYQLPQGWEWVRFPDLGEFGRGKSKHRPRNDLALYRDGKYPLVQTGDVARANGVISTHTGLYNDVGLAQSRL